MDATLARSQQECLNRFLAAVRDGRSGDYAKASALVERIRGASGDAVAERAKKEIWNFIRSDKRA